jgi:uncharacterized protein YuzE
MEKIKIGYFANDDIAYIWINIQFVFDSNEVLSGVVFDYDNKGKLSGIEIFDFLKFADYHQLENKLLLDNVNVDQIHKVIQLIKDTQQEYNATP